MAKPDPVSEYLATIGRKGGKARVPKGASMLTPEQRKAQGKAGADIRWAGKRGKRTKKKTVKT